MHFITLQLLLQATNVFNSVVDPQLHGSVSIVTATDWRIVVQFLAGAEIFSPHHHVLNGSGAHPSSPVIKQPGHEADDSSPSSSGQECLDLYHYSPVHLHGTGLN
jgi:hypothetical protein